MSIEVDPKPLLDLQLAIRRVSDELEQGTQRRRVAADHARARWRGGHRRTFDETSARVDVMTSRTLSDLAVLRRLVQSFLDGAA